MPSASCLIPLAVPVWLDCDPGNDDVFAILLAAFHPSFSLLGISTVHGNVNLDKTTRNTLAVLEAMKFTQNEIRVYKGEALPLAVNPVHAEAIHGSYGIGGADLPETPGLSPSTDWDYLEAMKEAILNNEGDICIVCTGALTNLARFIETYPGLLSKIRLVSVMGGAFNCGNVAPNVEFNIRADPHAALMVFETPALANKILLAPLNLTHTALATERVRSEIYDADGANNSPLRLTLFQILTFYNDAYIKQYNHRKGPPIHDPLALFLLLPKIANETPELALFADSCDFHYLQRRVHVITEGKEAGRTLFVNDNMDPLRVEKGGLFVGQSVHIPLFWRHLLEALDLADHQVASRS